MKYLSIACAIAVTVWLCFHFIAPPGVVRSQITHAKRKYYDDLIQRFRQRTSPKSSVKAGHAGSDLGDILTLIQPSLTTDGQLAIAIDQGDAIKIEKLLSKGADPNYQGLELETPLMHASQNGESPEIVELLLKGGANPNLQDVDGYTALMFARRNSNPEIIKLLFAYGAIPSSSKVNLSRGGDFHFKAPQLRVDFSKVPEDCTE